MSLLWIQTCSLSLLLDILSDCDSPCALCFEQRQIFCLVAMSDNGLIKCMSASVYLPMWYSFTILLFVLICLSLSTFLILHCTNIAELYEYVCLCPTLVQILFCCCCLCSDGVTDARLFLAEFHCLGWELSAEFWRR